MALEPCCALGCSDELRPGGQALGVWSRDEVTRIDFKDVGHFGPCLADRFERRLQADSFEMFGEIAG